MFRKYRIRNDKSTTSSNCIPFSQIIVESKEKDVKKIAKSYSVTNTGIHTRDSTFKKELSEKTINKLVYKGDLVIGMSRTILNWGIMKDEIGSVSPAYSVYSLVSSVDPLYLEGYIKMNIHHFYAILKPSTREGQSLDKNALMQRIYAEPTKRELELFHLMADPIISEQRIIESEINKMIELRDYILPKLISGEINVSSLADSQLNNHLLAGFLLVKNIIILLRSKLLGKLNEESISIVVSELTQILNDCIVETKKKEPEHQNADILNSFLSAKRLEGCSEKTISYYQSTLGMFLETSQCSITSINTDHIRNYLSEYQSKRKSSKVTIDNIRRIFSSFFSWLEDEEYILKSPVRRIHKVKFGRTVKETFTDEELERMRDSCDSIRNLSILDTFISTGMRVGELVRLNISDIDFNGRECIVFGKGDCERRVYFDARTKLHLQNYLEQRSDSNPALFVTQHKPIRRITINGIESMLKTLGKGIGIEDIHPHKFRRTMATRAIDKGMPIEQVQKLLGHVRIDTTLHYAMVNQENVKNAHKKYVA